MKSRGLLLAAVAGILLGMSASVASAQSSVNLSTNANAQILAALRLTFVRDLNFGSLVPSASAGTVTVTPASARSRTGGVTLVTGAAPQSARFTVQGQRNKSYTIALPASVSIASGGNSMSVATFTSNLPSPSTLPNNGRQTLNVGATVAVAADQPAGTYASTFTVTVAYN